MGRMLVHHQFNPDKLEIRTRIEPTYMIVDRDTGAVVAEHASPGEIRKLYHELTGRSNADLRPEGISRKATVPGR